MFVFASLFLLPLLLPALFNCAARIRDIDMSDVWLLRFHPCSMLWGHSPPLPGVLTQLCVCLHTLNRCVCHGDTKQPNWPKAPDHTAPQWACKCLLDGRRSQKGCWNFLFTTFYFCSKWNVPVKSAAIRDSKQDVFLLGLFQLFLWDVCAMLGCDNLCDNLCDKLSLSA